MPHIMHITTQDDLIQARYQDKLLASTSAAALPNRAEILQKPYTHGAALFQALGGEELLALLNADPQKTLYLDIPLGDPADLIP